MARATINVWGKVEGIDADLSGNTYLYVPRTEYMWVQIIPSEKLSAVLCLLESVNKMREDVKTYKLEMDLVMELGFEVVNWLGGGS